MDNISTEASSIEEHKSMTPLNKTSAVLDRAKRPFLVSGSQI
jgi:hypothetical protein